MATPPGAAFDEPAHFVKAVGAGALDLYGEPLEVSAAEREAFEELGRRRRNRAAERALLRREVSAAALRWQERTTRQFEVPRRLIGPELGCANASVETTGQCLERDLPAPGRTELGSYVGTYEPFVYVPAGLAARAADDAQTAVRLGRAAILALSLSLLVLAVLLVWDPRSGATSLLGVAAAVTPMVVFTASALSASGPEIAAGICFTAALVRLTRAGAQPGWAWAAAAFAGAGLAVSRPLGVPFVLLIVAATAALAGPRTALERLRSGGRAARRAALVIGVGVVTGVVWEVAYQPRPAPGGEGLLDAVRPSLENISPLFRHVVGVFGGLDSEMPDPAYLLWGALLVALLGAAFAAGERVAAVALPLGAFAVVMALSLGLRELGSLQGRYALPVLVLVPLWAGELVHRGRDQLGGRALRALTAGTFTVVAAVHAVGWYANGRRFAVGDSGSWLYPFESDWAPPLGWLPWLVLAAAGCAAWLLAASTSSAPPMTPTPVVKMPIMDSKRSSST